MRRTSVGRLGVVLGFVLAFLLAVPEARADRATEMKAREAFASGRYDDALGLFAKLYAETLHPVYLRNIGRCHQKMRQPEKAIDKFREYLAKEKKISADERKEIDGYIKEMEAMQEEQARQATPPPPANPPPPVTPIQPTSPTSPAHRRRIITPRSPRPRRRRPRRRWCPSRRPRKRLRYTRSGGSGPASASWSRGASWRRS